MSPTPKHNQTMYSFTLVELIIVIAILAILAGVVIFAIQPGRMIDQSNDSKRVTELQSIAKAIQYITIIQSNLNFGDAHTVYISLPDDSATCASYALPSLPSGYTYACKNSDDYRKIDGNGWIPMDFRESDFSTLLSTLPVDPVNNVDYYYSYNPGGSYELNAFLKSDKYINSTAMYDGGDALNTYEIGYSLFDMPNVFPRNWIKVPGNSLYGTADFWVMQFEAKYSISGKSANNANTCRYEQNYDTWDWGKIGTDCPSSWSNTNVVSSPNGSPIAGVTHNEAKAICESLGAHLITNQEWMTIARNAANQKQNWTSGTVGTGYLFNGNSGDSNRGYNGPDPDKGFPRNPRAILTLSNNQSIYDLSGNVYEHVMKDADDTLVQSPQPNTSANDGQWKFSQFTSLVGYGTLSYNEIRPANDTWNTDKGVGGIYHYDGAAPSNRVLLRGGDWQNGSYAGAFVLSLNWCTTNQGYDVGFRCAR